MFKAAIRVNKFTSIAQMRGASLHAQRHDDTGKARVREGAVPGAGLSWSKSEENDRDYLAAFKAHKAELGAAERKGAPIALQAICVVSPEWVQKAGDLHDPDNPHNRQLFDQAKAWAESWAGKDAVFASRLDLDEKGGAVVDLMISPVRESRGKPVISTNKAMGEVKALTGERNEYSALQTSWADWCGQHLDRQIVRGTRKEITQRQHLSPETYGAVMDKARESVRGATQGLVDAVKVAKLSAADRSLLSAVLTVREEVIRHKAEGRAYEPPEGPVKLDQVRPNTMTDAWPLINAVRYGAERVFEAAQRLGMGLRENMNNRYENGRDIFPDIIDRIHVAAVVAKCGAFMARTGQMVKNTLWPDRTQLPLDYFAPEESHDEVERHEVNLGIAIRERERQPEVEATDAVERDSETDIEAEVHNARRGGPKYTA